MEKRAKMMIKMEYANGIVSRLKQAQDTNDWARMSDILNLASENDVQYIESILSDLTEHHKWLIRASIVEMIGDLRLRQLVEPVKVRLKDKHPVVRAFALMAYYDLLGTKALPAIEEVCGAENIGLRFTALALHYAETGDEETLDKFNRILESKRRYPKNHHTTVNIFDRYYNA
jgi:HEAT repeat protein